MEIPDLVTQRLGDEEVTTTVNLGDEDVACFTPTRTLIYRGEGLLSDESVEVYDHDIERLSVSEGRRKTKFTLAYVDRTEKFAISSAYTEQVIENLIDGILGVAGLLDDDESVSGVYRFSELTLIITDKRLVRHIGNVVWDDDFEEYSFDDVTGLSFEEGSVATQIVLSVNGRPQRIKAPNDEVPLLKRTLTETVCAYHDVQSLGELNAAASADADDESAASPADSGLTLDEDITPLVGESDAVSKEQADPLATPTTDDEPAQAVDETATADATETNVADASRTPDRSQQQEQAPDKSHLKTVEQHSATEQRTSEGNSGEQSSATGTQTDTTQRTPEPAIDPEEFEQLQDQVKMLTTAVQRQNDLLRQQHETIQQLLDQR